MQRSHAARAWRSAALIFAFACVVIAGAPARPRAQEAMRTYDDPLLDPVSEAGQRARGFYASGPFVKHKRLRGLLAAIRGADLDAVVIDLKDGTGRVTYDTAIPILRPQVINYLRDARGLVAALKAEGIYTIARVVCFADPVLPGRRPERAIRHVRRGTPWRSWGTGGTWLDPYNRENHRMVVALAREAEALGFDEIQLDYVRFPVDDGTEYAEYPAFDGTPRPRLLIELLRAIDEAVRIPIGTDVFGLTAYRDGDPSGLGQDLEAWVDHVEVFTPMLYVNSMRTWNLADPMRSQTLVQLGVAKLRERVGPRPVIRPFLQSFPQGTRDYSPRFIADQIRGARVGEADGFLFWHPGSDYSMLRRGMASAARGLSPFPIDERAAVRRAWVAARQAESPIARQQAARAAQETVARSD